MKRPGQRGGIIDPENDPNILNKYLDQDSIRESEFDELLLRFPSFVNQVDEEGKTPLLHALVRHHDYAFVELIKVIEKLGIDLKYEYEYMREKTLLQYVLERRKIPILERFLNFAGEEIDKDSLINGNNVYSFVIDMGNISPLTRLGIFLVLLRNRFTLPVITIESRTVAEETVKCFRKQVYTIQNSTMVEFMQWLGLAMNILELVCKRSLETNGTLDQLLRAQGAGTILHVCVRYNAHMLLDFVLGLVKSNLPGILRRIVSYEGRMGFSALMVCCDPRHHKEASLNVPEESRIECARILLRYGANPNQTIRNGRVVALHIAIFSPKNYLPKQEEIIICLLENGANINFQQTRDLEAPLFYLVMSCRVSAVKFALEKGLLKKGQTLGRHESHPARLAINQSSYLIKEVSEGRINQLFTRGLDIRRRVDELKKLLLLLAAHDIKDTVFLLQHLIMFNDGDILIKPLFVLFFEYPHILQDLAVVPFERFMTIATMCRTWSIFRLFISNGFLFSKPMKLEACRNNPSHRWCTFANTIEKYVYHGKRPPMPGRSNISCDICGSKVMNSGENKITSCSRNSCDLDICQACAFFSLGVGTQGVDAYDLASRRKDCRFLTNLFYLKKVEDKEDIYKYPKFKDNIDAFLNAKLDDPVLLGDMELIATRLGMSTH